MVDAKTPPGELNFLSRANGTSRIADNSRPGGNISGHDRAGADDRAIAYRDATDQDRSTADPDASAYRYRPRDLHARSAQFGILVMFGTIDMDPRPQHAAVADAHAGAVEDRTAGIHIDPAAKRYIDAIGAVKRRLYEDAFADLGKESR